MRQIAYPTAVGCGCLMGSHPSLLCAAEWSISPSYSSSIDYDTNRQLLLSSQGSEASVLTADLRFKRAMEDSDFYVEPRYSLRRYSDNKFGNGDDRYVTAGYDRSSERDLLNLSASLWDQSTLQSELLETGVFNANTDRRQEQVGASETWNETERRQLVAQISYSNVTYHGPASDLLPGYRYTSANIGERALFSERGSFTVSAYGSDLSSDFEANSSHEYGLQGEFVWSFSERTKIDASLGESSRRLLGSSGHGTDAALTFTHELTRGNLSLSYTRSLVPQGTGILIERQQYNAVLARPLGPYLDGALSVTHVTNNETAVLLHLERRSYDYVSGSLSWRPTETLNVTGSLVGLYTQLFGDNSRSVHDWHSIFMVTWTPHGTYRSW